MDVIKIVIDIAKSPHITLELDKAIDMIRCLESETSGTTDLEETLRIINSFEEYYRLTTKRYEEYLSPKKSERESIEGKAIVHKIKLMKINDRKSVEIVFDRRCSIDLLKNCLYKIGFREVVVEKQLF